MCLRSAALLTWGINHIWINWWKLLNTVYANLLLILVLTLNSKMFIIFAGVSIIGRNNDSMNDNKDFQLLVIIRDLCDWDNICQLKWPCKYIMSWLKEGGMGSEIGGRGLKCIWTGLYDLDNDVILYIFLIEWIWYNMIFCQLVFLMWDFFLSVSLEFHMNNRIRS